MNPTALPPRQVASWIYTVSAGCLRVPVKNGDATVQLEVVAKGDPRHATRALILCAGFGTTGRSFARSFKAFRPAEHPETALVSLSLLGSGVEVPTSVNLAPDVLFNLYADTIRAVCPQAETIAVLGNSMGGLFALGTVFRLSGSDRPINAHFVGDNIAPPDTVGPLPGKPFGQCRTGLHRLLALILRLSRWLGAPKVFHAALGLSFRMPGVNRLIARIFARTLHNKTATAEDRDFLRITLAAPAAAPHLRSPCSILASLGSDFLLNVESALFSRGGPLTLPAGGEIYASTADAVFDIPSALSVAMRLRTASGNAIAPTISDGPHLETTPRALTQALAALEKNSRHS